MKSGSIRLRTWLVSLVVVATVGLAAAGCSTVVANRDPTGEVFPAVSGKNLDGRSVALPNDFAGRPAVLLIGYEQSAQFDIDRWVMGLLQAKVSSPIVEVPTIPGLLPTIASGWIDDGMRSGIPKEDWGSVVTLYGETAKPVLRLTGNQKGNLARILVLDPRGKIVWFDDKGFSPRKVLELADRVAELDRNATGPSPAD